MALRQKSGDQPQAFPEADMVAKEQNAVRVSMKWAGALLAGTAALGTAWFLNRRSA
jgi:hypothetical protein